MTVLTAGVAVVKAGQPHRAPPRILHSPPSRRAVAPALLASSAAVAALVVGVGWVAQDNDLAPVREARERTFVDVTGCLLTDAQGLRNQVAAAVWSGLQGASAQTRARANYLPTVSGKSVADAVPYVNTLVISRCTVIAAVGAAQVAAVLQVAPGHPEVHFAVVGAARGKNVVSLPADPVQAGDRVRQVLAAAAVRGS